ncbi:hypothetical protein [Polaromonas jejuensis]|uniref:Uncharacterized protein n=1 Tax=Polaromonas jejuensis TaxID=457502 RepID=A0ABW0Q6D7_9BURK|nr:hypothetical protein [Polaromonas jejuensis]
MTPLALSRRLTLVAFSVLALGLTPAARSADQMQAGAGNARAMQLAQGSPLVTSSMQMLRDRLPELKSVPLRRHITELLDHEKACVRHRAGLNADDKARILDELAAAGLVDKTEAENIQGGLMAGVFPPVGADGSACPRMPQGFFSAPGGATGGHHSEPGGLPVHEAFNDLSAIALARNYRLVYGTLGANGLPVVTRNYRAPLKSRHEAFAIDGDIVIGAPIWHDWAKTIVFQWNADGTEFTELNFGGNGQTDNNGATGNSKTGAHHILGIAEAMKRGLPPDFVTTVASAHSVPTYGSEYKVVNWLRAAAIIAQIDPYAKGYLRRDDKGAPRLSAVRKLGDIDLNAAPGTQPNTLVEYVLHNLSDADYVFTGPAAATVALVLANVAPEYGYDSTAPDYLFKFRHTALTYLSAERLHIVYSNGGLDAVRAELNKLRKLKLI